MAWTTSVRGQKIRSKCNNPGQSNTVIQTGGPEGGNARAGPLLGKATLRTGDNEAVHWAKNSRVSVEQIRCRGHRQQ